MDSRVAFLPALFWAAGALAQPAAFAPITPSGDFEMIVPLYMQFTDGKVAHIAGLTMRGNTTFEQKVSLGKVPANAKGIVINAYADILNDNTD